MPDYGRVAVEDLPATTPQLAPLYPELPWSLPGARLIKLAYEIDLEFTRDTLPAGLARPTPPYGTLVVTDAPQSPFGPFRMALQTIICRYRNFARAYALQGVIDNPVAMAAFREVLSYPLAPGTVDLTDDPTERSVRGVVASPQGTELAVFDVTGLEGAEAERVVIDAELTLRIPSRFAAAPSDEPPRLLQVNRAWALRDPHRGRFTVKFGSAGSAYRWGDVPVTLPIIAVDTGADLEFAPVEHVLSYIPER